MSNNEKSTRTVLIVEDELTVGNVVRKQLSRKGFDVLDVVDTGAKAIAAVRELKPDVVLMDVHLSGDMDGIAAAKAVQGEFDVPVIYLTGDAMDDTVDQAREAQAYGYLLKPINDRELITTIEIALYKHGMERRLKESEILYRSLTQAMPQKVWTADHEGRATFFNSQWEIFTGMISDQCFGDMWWEAVNPIDLLRFKTAWQRSIETGEIFQIECRLQGNDGRPRWHLARAVPAEIGNGTRQWFGTFTDIQAEKDREQALLDSEAQKRAVFEGALDAVIMMDREGRITDFNPAAEKTFGKPRYEVIGEPLAETILGTESREFFYRQFQNHLTTSSGNFLNARHELAGLHADGHEFPLELACCRVPTSGQPVFTIYARDLPGRPAENSAPTFDREKLDLQTRVKTLEAMLSRCAKCDLVHVPGAGWVDLEKHIVLQSDTTLVSAVCGTCEKTLRQDELEDRQVRLWSKEFRTLYP
ncbi:MAG: PAS domain S-box protein [Verrucomicrobiae bacterium]|jgi:PAS domain S-box-containing protein|nr:PAS domain S-box protein [Verrucomicrobiae bacterium]